MCVYAFLGCVTTVQYNRLGDPEITARTGRGGWRQPTRTPIRTARITRPRVPVDPISDIDDENVKYIMIINLCTYAEVTTELYTCSDSPCLVVAIRGVISILIILTKRILPQRLWSRIRKEQYWLLAVNT